MSEEYSSEAPLIGPGAAGSRFRGEWAARRRSEAGCALALAVRDKGNPPLLSVQFFKI